MANLIWLIKKNINRKSVTNNHTKELIEALTEF
jgi:hypothetical protein